MLSAIIGDCRRQLAAIGDSWRQLMTVGDDRRQSVRSVTVGDSRQTHQYSEQKKCTSQLP